LAGEPDAEHQYSPSRWALQPLVEHLDRYRQLSARHIGADLTRRGSPLLVYVHGGYWQELSASDSLFMADDALASGIGVHAVEYRLAPAVTIAGIVEECVRDVAAVIARVGPSRTVLAGSSAGAHLAAMVRAHRRVAGLIDATVLLSGIYDLRPLVGTSVNDALGLDEAGATVVAAGTATTTGSTGVRTYTLTTRARDLSVVGAIRPEQWEKAKAVFAVAPASDLKVLVFHHNVLRGDLSRRWGLVNRADGIGEALQTGADLVLNGHDHQTRIEPVELMGRRMVVSHSTSFCARTRGGLPAAFQEIEIAAQEFRVRACVWSAEARDFAPRSDQVFAR
jgi:3',5'-cyclic AMP phosphodiesterase CpdA